MFETYVRSSNNSVYIVTWLLCALGNHVCTMMMHEDNGYQAVTLLVTNLWLFVEGAS